MDDLIQDLLEYSRLGRDEMRLGPVELEPIVASALQELKATIAEARARVDVRTPLPAVIGARPILLQIVQNMVANAIKFVPAGTTPEIRIYAEARDRRVRLWVEDNGIGIDPRHHERIFRVFERLHGADVYHGTGVGLAIVRKGAERMRGRCGVESTPGAGSRFWIELAQAPEGAP